VSDSGDAGKPLILDDNNPMTGSFIDMAKRVAQQVAIVNAKASTETTVTQ